MKARTLTTLLTLTLLVGLSACVVFLVQNRPEQPADPPVQTQQPTAAPTEEEGPSQQETEAPTEAPTTQPAVDPTDAMLAAYQFTMQQFSFEHVYPDGSPIGFNPDNGYIEENSFAIFDVNGDGTEELILSYITAPMAGMLESVYRYDADTDSLVPMLQEFPSIGYYTGGKLLSYASHNNGLSVSVWPYTLFTYDTDTQAYTFAASVYAWERDVTETDFEGNHYPDDVDTEGTGIVYCVTDSEGARMLSQSAYESWYAEQMGDAALLDIPYQSVSEQNIAAICDQSR